jgi:hypothetical protein
MAHDDDDGRQDGAARPCLAPAEGQADSARELLSLSRGVDRVSLKERRDTLASGGPSAEPLLAMSEEDIRTENAELSIFFIEDTWRKAQKLLAPHGGAGQGALPVILDGRLAPLSAFEQSAAADDPLAQLLCHAEIFLLICAGSVEQELVAEIFRGLSSRGALHLRYRDLLARLRPVQTPASHAVENSFAGMQITMALVEVLPRVAQLSDDAMSTEQLVAALTSSDFERLVLALAATRAAVGNALLSQLVGEPFQRWRHCLHRLESPHLGRLSFRPECFFLQGCNPHSLQIRPEILHAVRQSVPEFVTPGRHRQLRCPALFADGQAGTVALEFVRWLVQVAIRYYLPVRAAAAPAA